MPTLRAGSLRHRFGIQSKTESGDGQGGTLKTWATIATVWGRAVPADTTGDTFEAGETISRRRVTVTIRRRGGLTSAMRLVRGAQLLEILSIADSDDLPDGLQLYCRELPLPATNPQQASRSLSSIITLPGLQVSTVAGRVFTTAGLRRALTDAAIAGVWTRDAVRLNAAGTVAAVDDARCSTLTGRLACGGVSADYLNCGNYAGLNGATTATITICATLYESGAVRGIVSRYGNTAALRQFYTAISAASKLIFVLGDGATATAFTWTSSTTFAVGSSFLAWFQYNGAAGTDLGKATLYYRLWNQASQSWGPEQTDAGASVTAGFPAQFMTLATTENLAVGRNRTSGSGANPWRGVIGNAIRIRPGVLLTAAQRAADLLAPDVTSPDWVPPAVWPDLQNGGTNLGTTGTANNGAIVGGCVFVSDDRRWANPLVGGGGSTNPSWDPAAGAVTFDGFDDYLRGAGGGIALVAGDAGLAYIGTLAPETGVEQRFADVGDNASASLLFLRQAATTNAVGAGGPTGAAPSITAPTAPSSYAGARVLHGRRTIAAPNVVTAAQLGAAAEGTPASVTGGALTALSLTVGASRSTTLFAAMSWRASVLYQGDYTGKAPYVNDFATSLGATP